MTLDEEAKNVLLEILRIGLVRIRNYAFSGLTENCGYEADHLHNLPELIQSFNWDLLKYYIRCQRSNISSIPEYNIEHFKVHWDELDTLVLRWELAQ